MNTKHLRFPLALVISVLALGGVLGLLRGVHSPSATTWAQAPPAAPAVAPPSTGGPDAFGYVYTDSLEAGGPAYTWIDVSASGTPLSFADTDEDKTPVDLPQTMTFYGKDYTSLYVTTNGYLSFEDTDVVTQCTPAERQPPYALAAFCTDLDVGNTVYTAVTTYEGHQALIVQYDAVTHTASGLTATFQVILDLEDDAVIYQYRSVPTSTVATTTVGIAGKATNQDDVLTYCQGTADCPPQNGLAVRFALQPVPVLNLRLTPNYDFPVAGDPITYTVVMSNSGDALASGAVLTNVIPAGMSYVTGSVAATGGTPVYLAPGHTIRWDGDLDVNAPVTLTYAVQLETGDPVYNSASLNHPDALQPAGATSTPADQWSAPMQVDSAHDFDNGDNLGSWRHIAVDASGVPHVAYGGEGLYYAVLSDTTWLIDVVTYTSSYKPALLLDDAGLAHIAFLAGQELWLARQVSTTGALSWTNEFIAPIDNSWQFGYLDMQQGSDGRLHLVYDYQSELYYTVYSDTSWLSSTMVITESACNLDDSSSNYGFSLALDQNDVPHVACVQNDIFPRELRLYTYTATAPWTTYEVITKHLSYCTFPSLGYRDSTPHVSYFEGNYTVRYGQRNGSWQTEEIDDLGSGMQFGTALDIRDGQVAIAYAVYQFDYPDYPMTIRLASRPLTGTSWTTKTVDDFVSDYFGLSWPTMALGGNGRAHLAYYHSPDKTLRHVVGSQTLTTTAVDESRSFGAAAIKLGNGGNTHIAYLSGGLRYALNLSGTTTWTKTLVDPSVGDDWNVWTSLAVDAADVPHVAYVDSGQPVYHATMSGTTWITRQVDARDDVQNSGISIGASTTGTAHLTYLDVEGGDLVVRHAAFDGSGWTTETLATAGPNLGNNSQTPQLVVQGSKVYILYADCTAYRADGEDYPIDLTLGTWDGGWTFESLHQFSGQCTAFDLAFQLLQDDTGRRAMVATIDSDSVRPSPQRVFKWLSGGGVQKRAVVTGVAEPSSIPVSRSRAPQLVMGSTYQVPHAIRGNGFEYLAADYYSSNKNARYTDESGNRTDYIPVGTTTSESTDVVGIDRQGSGSAVVERAYSPSGLYTEYTTGKPKPRCCLSTVAEPDGAGNATPPYSEGACGAQVPVAAQAEDGWVFSHWSGAASGEEANTVALRNGRVPYCSVATAHFVVASGATAGKTANPSSPTQVYPETDIGYRVNLSWKGPEDAIISVIDAYPWPRVTFNGGLDWGPYIVQCQHNAGPHSVSCSGQFPGTVAPLSTQASFNVKTTCDIYTTQDQSGPIRNTSTAQVDGFLFNPAATTEVKAPFRLKASTPKFMPQADFDRGHAVLLYTVPKGDEPNCCTSCALDVYVVVDGDTANPRKMENDGAGLNDRTKADFNANDCHHSLWFEPTESRSYRLDLYVVKQGDPFEPLYLADTLNLEPNTEPGVAVYTDLRELFKEFNETSPNSASADTDGNCWRDYYDALERIVRYADDHEGVVIDVRQDAYSADRDYYANIATRRTMGQEIDANVTKKLEGFKLDLFNIAVIGDDAVLPYYRVQVPTGAFSETGYLRNNADGNPTVLDTQSTAGGANKGYLMSDVPYATYETNLPTYPRPNISIGRIFYLTPMDLIDGIDGYETPISTVAAQTRASAVCLNNEWRWHAASATWVPKIKWDDIFNRAIRPVLQNRYGAGVQTNVPYTGPVAFQNGQAYVYRGAVTPWNAVTTTQRAVENTDIMFFYSHANQFVWTSEARRLLNGGSVDPRVQGSRDVDRRDLANAGVGLAMSTGCHSGYNTAYRQTNVNHRLYRDNIVRAMLDGYVAYYAPTVYGYGANDVTSHHDLLIHHFLKGTFHRFYGSVGDAYYIALRKFTASGDADLDKYVVYSMHLYGLPTQPLRTHAAQATLRSTSIDRLARRPTALNADVTISHTLAISNFAVSFDAEGRAVFDVPQQGGRTGEVFGPILPAVVRTFALPSDFADVAVTLVASQTHLYPNPVTLQTLTPVNLSFGPQTGTFDQTGLYPTSVLTYRLVADVGGPMLEVTAIPLQYDLDTQQVTLYDSLTYQITYQAPTTATLSNVQVNAGSPVAVSDADVPISVTLDSAVAFTGTLIWSIEDGAGALVADDVASLDVSGGTTILGWDVDAIGWQPGPKYLWVAARDAGGDVLATGQAAFQVDGAWLEADVARPIYTEADTEAEIQARVRDEEGAGVSGQEGLLSLSVNGQDAGPTWNAGVDGLYTTTVALGGLPAGRHVFETGLNGLSDDGGFAVDRYAPTSTVHLVATGGIDDVWVDFDWQDDAAYTSIYTIEYQVDQGTWQVWQVVTLDYDPPEGDLFGPSSPVAVDLTEHVYCFRSRAQDLAGHVEPEHVAPDACTEILTLCNSPKAVAISGPATTTVQVATILTATVTPLTATNVLPLAFPLTYTWQATTQPSQTHVISEMIDTAAFTWSAGGDQVITVTVASPCDVVVSDTHTLTIPGQHIYLPLVLRNSS
jgi:uncharacterized repeat protein (TIGR01451 family)